MTVLHTIKAWLYENMLTEDANDYSARVSAERALSVQNICEAETTASRLSPEFAPQTPTFV